MSRQIGNEIHPSFSLTNGVTYPLARSPPKQLGPYRLIKLLGSGRTAEVHCARHKTTKELVAIKLLHEFLTDQQMKQKFQAEAEVVQMLSHPSIVQILDADFYQQTRPYIVMTYAPGNSLRQKHPSGTVLSFQTVLFYTKQIASALAYAHQKNIVHCDVKPENILVGKDNHLLLSDFGIARIRETTLSQTTRDAFGTATYMAPEQFRGKYSAATDQYALAAIVYEWLCGHPPFSGENYNQLQDRHMNMPIPSLLEACTGYREGMSETVEQVILKALAKNPQERFPSILAFSQALEQALLALKPVTAQQTDLIAPESEKETVLAFQTPSRLIAGERQPRDLSNQADVTITDRRKPFRSQPWRSVEKPPLPKVLTFALVPVIILVVGFASFYTFRFYIPSHEVQGIGITTGADGELIGISDGSYTFDTNRPDGSLKTAASTAFRQGDLKTAISDWNAAHAQETNDAEPLIYQEDQRVIASKAPYITLVVGTMLTDTTGDNSSAVSTGRDDLQGAYITQLTYNRGHLLPGGFQVVLLIANAGSNSDYVKGIAQQIVQIADHDSHVVGVMGWSFSAYALAASSIPGPAHIPMISAAASSDALSETPYFFSVAPPNSVQGIVGAVYAEQQLHARRAAVFIDPTNSYTDTLATDFMNRFKQDNNLVVKTENYTVGDTATFPTELQDALQAGVDLIYFSGYSDDMSVLLTDIDNIQTSTPFPSILGGDALYILGGYQPSSAANFTRLHFTAFAYPDEWAYRNIPAPAFFVTYAHTYDPNNAHVSSPYGYDRPDGGAILAYDAVLTLLRGYINALSAYSNSTITPTALYQGISMITTANPVVGVSGRIAFDMHGSTPSDPVNKAIVVLSVGAQGQILIGQGGIQGCYQPSDPQC